METNLLDAEEPKVTSNVVKGLTISLLLIVISLISYFTKNMQSSWASWATNLILLIGIVVSVVIYANQLNSNVTFGNAFAHGFKVTAVVVIIQILFTIIFVLLFPDIKTQALETAKTEMERQGKVDDASIEKAMEMMSKFFYAFMFAGIVVWYLIVGVISSLIGAAVAKKNPQPIFN